MPFRAGIQVAETRETPPRRHPATIRHDRVSAARLRCRFASGYAGLKGDVACQAVARGRLVRLRPLGFGVTSFTRFASEGWWAKRDSNPRHPRCERGALPTELFALSRGSAVIRFPLAGVKQWRGPFLSRPYAVLLRATRSSPAEPLTAVRRFGWIAALRSQNHGGVHGKRWMPRCATAAPQVRPAISAASASGSSAKSSISRSASRSAAGTVE